MSKSVLSTALIAGLALAVLAPQQAHALQNPSADGTITITGTIVGQTCKVDGNAFGTSDNVTVALPTVLSSQLASAGQVAGKKSFTLAVTGCDTALKTVQTYFSGLNIDSTTGNLKNTGAAANVQVQLLNASDTVMPLNGADATAQNSQVVNLDSSGAADLSYAAQYYATGAAGAGDVNTSVAFTMIYQ